jgi:hypothetical protein
MIPYNFHVIGKVFLNHTYEWANDFQLPETAPGYIFPPKSVIEIHIFTRWADVKIMATWAKVS